VRSAPHTNCVPNQSEAAKRLGEGVELLSEFQERLAAQDEVGVLLVLQGIDASGKDSTIKHIMSGVNPQGVEVRSFKQPSVEELSHDWLWRYQRVLPERGRIGIFNRSHFEEVLVVRVHPELLAAQDGRKWSVDEGLWKRRFAQINDWERHLVDSNVRVVKVFLNISKAEQAKRFRKRIDDLERNWKFSENDVKERRYWDDYQYTFGEMLSNTSTEWAPWHVVPADHKWYGRLATATILIEALSEIDPKYPVVDDVTRQRMQTVRRGLLDE
jgi:PPK2 family polyphosphate:nucleotide phosphotransferase